MSRKTVLFAILTLVVALVLTGCPQAKQPKRQGTDQGVEKSADQAKEAVDNRTLVEVAKADPFKSCEDCHKGTVEVEGKQKDITLAGQTNALETSRGTKHPTVPDNITLQGCLRCHAQGNLYESFVLRMHKAHGNSKVFHPKYKGDCTSCHTLNEEGKVTLKGAQ